jgi:hypothetical protein
MKSFLLGRKYKENCEIRQRRREYKYKGSPWSG